MNWYKKAQQKEPWNWNKLVTIFGLTSISGMAALYGLGFTDVQEELNKNPQEVIKKIENFKQQEQSKVNPSPSGGVSQEDLNKYFKNEYEVILKAAKRNHLALEDYDLLFAIRKTENGGPRREFGIIHPKCEAEMDKRPNETLDIQAGWAAATIVKNRARWEKAGKPGDFNTFLQKRYCPVGAKNDPSGLNKNWLQNVNTWENRI